MRRSLIRNLTIYLLAGMWSCLTATAQQSQLAWSELKQICRAYETATVMSFQAHMKMYPAAIPSEVRSTLEVSCSVSNNRSYTRLGPVEMVRTGKLLLAIDHEDKTILLTGSPADAGGKQLSEQVFNMQQFLETLQQSGASIQQFMRESGHWIELSGLATPGIHKCNILYDPSTHLVKKVWMQVDGEMAGMQETGVVEINYDHYQLSEPAAERFTTARFVHINGKEAVLQEKYKNYTLINQL